MFVVLESKATNLLIEVKDKNSLQTLTNANIILSKKGEDKQHFTGKAELKDVTYPVKISCTHTGY